MISWKQGLAWKLLESAFPVGPKAQCLTVLIEKFRWNGTLWIFFFILGMILSSLPSDGEQENLNAVFRTHHQNWDISSEKLPQVQYLNWPLLQGVRK